MSFSQLRSSINSRHDTIDASNPEFELTEKHLIGPKKFILQGFTEAYKFVKEYDTKMGPLYILFMSNVDEEGKYWCPDCQKAKQPVYEAFDRAPLKSRIVEIRVGERDYWANEYNEFRLNELFYIDYIPTLMRYDGNKFSSNMLSEKYCLDSALLEYVFRVENPTAGLPKNNSIITMKDAKEVQTYLEMYDNSYPLFIFFVSGTHDFNGRLWCPYCDKADVSVMHYYNYTAPTSAVLLRTVVADSYKMWKRKKNPFKSDEFKEKVLTLKGVPYLARVTKKSNTQKLEFNEFIPEFYEKQRLIQFFNT
jgi:thiol-disulfide isomerase/thioredoxin